MLANYNPWGRPGGGAPNDINVRRRKTNIHYYDHKQQVCTISQNKKITTYFIL